MEKEKENLNKNKEENKTNYKQQFITTYFKWKTLEEQKKRVEELENISEKSEKNKK